MTQLHLSLLGTFAAHWGDQLITTFPTDKVRALLAYIAIEGKRPLRRETLATLLWPDYADSVAKRNLRQNLHRLKKLLDNLDPTLSDQLLTISRQTVQINHDLLWLDVAEVETATTAVSNHPHPHLNSCQPCLDQLTAVAPLIKGELLAGLTLPDAPLFEEWLTIQRERIHYQSLHLLEAVATANLKQGHYDQAHHYANQQISLEPWHEEAHRQIMLALAQQGQRSAALAHYATCCHMLENELGIAPAAATTTLYQQIVADELTPDSYQTVRLHHFPSQFTPFVGRKADCEQIISQLQKPACRLLTVVAPGGMGKTRLALAAATQLATTTHYPDGLFFVPLTAVTDRAGLLTAIAQAVNMSLPSDDTLEADLFTFLARKELLLLLDNFEQLLDEAEWPMRLLTAVPGLNLLITSRQPLGLAAEWLLHLDGLAYPHPHDETWLNFPAVHLFNQTASRAQAHFNPAHHQAAICHICHLVGGMPLALEMAAAWVGLLDPAQIADQIAANFDLLVATHRDTPPRQQSIQAVFAYSWELLTPTEQQTLAQLAIFQGSFSLEAAIAVTGGSIPTLTSLANKSLIRPQQNGRYDMHLLLRHFGQTMLAQWDDLAKNGRFRHATYFLEQITRHEAEFHTDRAPALRQAMLPDLDNVRQAWHWATTQQDTALLLKSQKGIGRFFSLLGLHQEAARLMAKTAAQLESHTGYTNKEAAIFLRYREGRIRLELGQYAQTADLMDAVCTYWQATNTAVSAVDKAYAKADWGIANWRVGNIETAHTALEIALTIAQTTNDKGCIAYILHHLGNVAFFREDAKAALHKIKQSLPLYREHGNLRRLAGVLSDLGSAYKLSQEDPDQANACYAESLTLYHQLGDLLGSTFPLSNQAYTALENQQYDLAQQLYEEVLAIGQQFGAKSDTAIGLHHLGLIALLERDDYYTAVSYFQESIRLAQAIHHPNLMSDALIGLTLVLANQSAFTSAARLAGSISVLRDDFNPNSIESQVLTQILASTQAALDEETFATSWAKGKSMNWAEAVAYALHATRPESLGIQRG